MRTLAAVLLLLCGCGTTVVEKPVMSPVEGPPSSAWACPRWPADDPLTLPAQTEDAIRWKQVEDARKKLAYDACKADLGRWRAWAKLKGYEP